MIALLMTPTLSFLPAYAPTHRPAVSHTVVSSRARARTLIAYLDNDDDVGIAPLADVHKASVPATFFTKTNSGLSYKDLERGDGESVPKDALVSIRFTATLLSTGEVVERSGSRPLTFKRGKELDMFDEAIEGMTPGSKRRVLILPESKYSALGDRGETIDFEIELVEVITGGKMAIYQSQRAAGSIINLLFWYYAAQTILEIFGVIQPGQAPKFDGQAIDVANAWAAAGLAQVGL